MGYQRIEYWYEPTDILRKHNAYSTFTHMSRDEHGFLSGIIKKIRPKKVLEVGVAEGGTTAMILKSLEMAKCESEMYSCDVVTTYKGLEVGTMVKHVTDIKYVKHKLLTGKLLKDNIEQIGYGIDLVILDTSHNVPGEIIEFLTVLPFLSDDAFVVLHDVNLCNDLALRSEKVTESFRKISTKVLFTSVSGEKYFDYAGENLNNIAAVRVNESTKENIADLFFALSHLWHIGISQEILKDYREFFSRYYSDELLEIWDLVIKNQNNYRYNMDRVHRHLKLLDKYQYYTLILKTNLYKVYKKLF